MHKLRANGFPDRKNCGIGEPELSDSAQPAAPTTQEPSNSNDGWAPGFRQSKDVPTQGPQQKSFGEAFNAAADDIAKDLGLDTAAGMPKKQAEQPKEPDDPNGDDELEFAPGKRIKRKELAKKLTESESWQKKYADLEKGSGQKFREAAEQRKLAETQLQAAQQAMQIKQRLEQVVSKNDEKALLQEFGIDPEKLKQKWIEEAYQDSQKSPEQREIDRLKAYEQQVAEFHKREQLEAQKQQQAQADQQKAEQTKKLAGNMSQAMMATADKFGLPRTNATIERMAHLLAGANAKGLDPTWEQLGQVAHDQWIGEVPTVFDSMSAEDFHKKIPLKTREKLRSFFLQQAQGPSPTQQLGSAPPPRAKPQKQLSNQEYQEFINNMRNQRSA